MKDTLVLYRNLGNPDERLLSPRKLLRRFGAHDAALQVMGAIGLAEEYLYYEDGTPTNGLRYLVEIFAELDNTLKEVDGVWDEVERVKEHERQLRRKRDARRKDARRSADQLKKSSDPYTRLAKLDILSNDEGATASERENALRKASVLRGELLKNVS